MKKIDKLNPKRCGKYFQRDKINELVDAVTEIRTILEVHYDMLKTPKQTPKESCPVHGYAIQDGSRDFLCSCHRKQTPKECEPCHPTSPECDACKPSLAERLFEIWDTVETKHPKDIWIAMADEAKKAMEDELKHIPKLHDTNGHDWIYVDALIERIKAL